ncbi:hypothetical protein HUG10_15670 [Halorarum halophilum]|uniref:Uncharacterized protein n=1 Tax=Halorarum halophilum TaxID=2743090 RepID=A0A7D5GJI6_9EURY|nr:hypothetical protein [Halobaculum halophilum]QLG28891.1 hypothetical protein HUG10_15670 [Halobaculum halophilum]
MGEETNHSRRRALQTIGSVAVAGLAGCNATGSSDPTQQPTDTSTATSTPTETSTETATNEHTGSEQTHEHTDAEPAEGVEFARNPEEVHPTLVEETSVSSDEVLIGYRLEDSSLPFETEVYHAPDGAEMQATKTYDTQDLSQVDLLPDQPQALDTVATDQEDIHYGTTTVGEPLAVTLVARHDGEAFDWSAWDRTGHPYGGHDEEDPALEVDCYCGGMVYTAPSGGTWARVIQVTPTERVDPGSTIVVNWTSSRVRT